MHLQCDEGIINFIIAKPEPVFVKSLNTLTNRHTSQYVSQEIIKIINVYGGHKFVTLIGDNANNIQRAFQIVKDSYALKIPLRCVAHILNLLCEVCLKLEPINAFISVATDTTEAIKRNQSMSALLAQIVKEKGSCETLKFPGKTRWGSYCVKKFKKIPSRITNISCSRRCHYFRRNKIKFIRFRFLDHGKKLYKTTGT